MGLTLVTFLVIATPFLLWKKHLKALSTAWGAWVGLETGSTHLAHDVILKWHEFLLAFFSAIGSWIGA
jgi:hypothetical protein